MSINTSDIRDFQLSKVLVAKWELQDMSARHTHLEKLYVCSNGDENETLLSVIVIKLCALVSSNGLFDPLMEVNSHQMYIFCPFGLTDCVGLVSARIQG